MLNKFLSIVFLLIFCLSDCNAKKVFVEKGCFSFLVESITNTAMLVNVNDNGVSGSISIPEFVKYKDDNCNVIVIDENAFKNVLDKIKSVVLPKYLIKHEQNTKIIRTLLEHNVEITQGEETINRIEDFKPFPQLGKLGWEHEDYMLVNTNVKSDWRSLNRFMNGY